MNVSSHKQTALYVLTIAAAGVVVWFILQALFRAASWTALPLMMLTAVFLILLILVQRGKGGGLAGAFGGMGGQSAFGTKAGDLFTRITVGVAAFWILLCVAGKSELGGPAEELLDPGLTQGPAATDSAAQPAPTPDGQLPSEGTEPGPADAPDAAGAEQDSASDGSPPAKSPDGGS